MNTENQQPSLEARQCKICGNIKPVNQFKIVYAKASRGQNYRGHTCLECYWPAHYERVLKNKLKDPEKYKEMRNRSHIKHRAGILEYKRSARSLLKRKVYEAYGGNLCACCGEIEPSFLTIDHIHEDGAEHRRSIRGTQGGQVDDIYRWIINNNFPEGFQVLCFNCNRSKYVNHGTCSHKLKEGSTTISRESRPKPAEAPSSIVWEKPSYTWMMI